MSFWNLGKDTTAYDNGDWLTMLSTIYDVSRFFCGDRQDAEQIVAHPPELLI